MMRKVSTVLAAVTIAACLMIGGLGAVQADGTPTAKAQDKQATGGNKSSAAPTAAETDDDPHGTVEAGPFEESTKMRGKVDADLNGIWLLVTRVEMAPGKFKTFPQLLKITQGKDGTQFNLLDVKLPEQIERSVFDANNVTLALWTPSPEMRQTLAQSWANLPPHKLKTINDFLYSKIEYTLIAPDGYPEAFGIGAKTSSGLIKVLEGSRFTLQVVENYKGRKLPPDTRVSQLMQRRTIYAVKTVEKDLIKGENSLGIVAAGAGTPIPLSFTGPFEMYRLADRS